MNIAILTGGTSSEREVALRSAQTVREVLEGRVDLDWYDLPGDLERLVSEKDQIDCAVPVFHGRGGEGGEIQGLLRTLGVPFVFSDVTAHAMGLDKAVTKKLVKAHGVMTPGWVELRRGDAYEYQHPVVVKPLDGGSSIGIEIARSQQELGCALVGAFEHSESVLIEDVVEGREFTVGVVEHGGEVKALPVVEIRSKNSFFDFESKYDSALAEEICPACVSGELRDRMQEMALAAHEILGARHLSRSDMMVDEQGEVWFIEINTIPGLTKESLIPKALEVAGIDLGELIYNWID